ncbi:MAG: hypothetical protein JSR44_15475 [Spirochaetes bacterium]|nr:hypothetical protein [Spirochaetota bacterium]
MLIEVRRELVKQDHRFLEKRFLQDAHLRLAIYIWQLPGDDEGEMLRFQISYKDTAIDWSAERGVRLAHVDDGDNPMGMKRSPILQAANSINTLAVERLCAYLAEAHDRPSLQFIRKRIETEVLKQIK